MAPRRVATAQAIGNEDLSLALEKYRRAKHKSAELTKAQQLIDKELERNEQEKRCLVTKRLMAGGQYKQWLEDVHRRTTIPYSKAWSLRFAAEIQTRLPPEVRDMILHHLWDIDPRRSSPRTVARSHVRPQQDHQESTWAFDTIGLYPHLLDIARSLVRVNKTQVRKLCDQSDLPHYLSPDYVGAVTAIEVVQSMYKAFNAADLLLCEPRQIEQVLTKDCYHVGLETSSAIRSLTVHCKMDRYRTPRPKTLGSCGYRYTVDDLAYVRKKEMKEDFKALLDIRKKGGFSLHILLIQRNIRLSVLAETIDALNEVYDAFRKNNASVTVSWTYRGHWQPGKVVKDDELVIKDITTFFDMPQEAWEYNMRRFLKKVQRRILPRHWKIDLEINGQRNPAIQLGISYAVHAMWWDPENEFTTDGEDDSDESGEEAGYLLQ